MFPLTYPNNSWSQFFESKKSQLDEISNEISKKQQELEGLEVFPESNNIFRAFELCDFDNEEDTVNTDDLDNLQDDNEQNTVNTNESQLKDNNLETSANLQKEQPQPEVK